MIERIGRQRLAATAARAARAAGPWAAAALVWLAASRAAAHQKWLWPNVFHAKQAPAVVSIDVTWSDTPFTAEEGIGEQPVAIVHADGQRAPLLGSFAGKTKSVAEAELTRDGVYRLESVDPPTYWTRVEANGQESWLKQPKNEVQGQKITRSDLYYSKAAAYVVVGAGESAAMPPADKEAPLEITPRGHVGRLRAGAAVELEVLSYGKPAGGAELKVFAEESRGHEPAQVVACDAQGVAKVTVDRPGRYMVACEMERAVEDDPKADIHSFNVYLTLQILPAGE